MKFFILIQKTALHIAAEKGNSKIIQLLLSHPKIDINFISIIFIYLSLIIFVIIYCHKISKHILFCYYLIIFISFTIIKFDYIHK